MLKLLIKHQLYEYAISTFFDRVLYNFAHRTIRFSDIQFGTIPGYEDGTPRITIIHNGVTYPTVFTVDLYMDLVLIHSKVEAAKMYQEALAYEFYRFTGIMVAL